MKRLLFAAALLLSACGVTPEKQLPTSNAELKVDIIGKVDGCTIYRFSDDGVHYFVRCVGAPAVATIDRHCHYDTASKITVCRDSEIQTVSEHAE